MKVGLLGSGTWGIALASVLAEKGHKLRWWSYEPEVAEAIAATGRHPWFFPHLQIPRESILWSGSQLWETFMGVEAIVLAIPSSYVAHTLQPVSLPEVPWVSCTKGIVPELNAPVSHYLRQRGVSDFAVLSGPSHAEEVVEKRPTWVAVASASSEAVRLAQELFASSYFHLQPTPWVESLEWAAVLKNIYAIALGAVGIWGDNARAAAASVALREMKAILEKWVPQEKPDFLSPGWAGDFLVTAYSAHSRNQRLGKLLAQGLSPSQALQQLGGMTAEGYFAALHLPSDFPWRDFPLLRAIISVLQEENSPTLLLSTLAQSL
ncbi:MAG: hypothetical protein NZ580_06110 [Bacteroidia bacterium]|nr:hypothetical protein [Bacteroidia bacterium]MDW8236384.1 hypothetical protein [Bacteroidia bacterium]